MYIDLINADIKNMNEEELIDFLETVRCVEERDNFDCVCFKGNRNQENINTDEDRVEYKTNAIYYNDDFDYDLLKEEDNNIISESEDGYIDISNLAIREIEGQLWLAPFIKDSNEVDIDNSIILKTPAYVKFDGRYYTVNSATDIKFIQ